MSQQSMIVHKITFSRSLQVTCKGFTIIAILFYLFFFYLKGQGQFLKFFFNIVQKLAGLVGFLTMIDHH